MAKQSPPTKGFDDQFARLFSYMQEQFGELRQEMRDIHTEMDRRFDAVDQRLDGLAGALEEDSLERAALVHKTDRHEQWLHQLADRTDTKLSYD